MIDIKDIASVIELKEHRIENVYLYGSRVYGTNRIDSDYDIKVIAYSMMVDKEFHEGEYNIHVTTPDIFRDKLFQHDISALECINAPKFARIQIKKNYNFVFNVRKLKKMILSQAYTAWRKAEHRINNGDLIRGEKSLFHCFRILTFGMQLVKHRKIVDFSEANVYWEQISNLSEEKDYNFEWEYYRSNFKPKYNKLHHCFRKANEEHNDSFGSNPFAEIL